MVLFTFGLVTLCKGLYRKYARDQLMISASYSGAESMPIGGYIYPLYGLDKGRSRNLVTELED